MFILRLPTSPLDQESFDHASAFKLFDASDSDVQRSLAVEVLSFEVRIHAENVVESQFGASEASPVERSAVLFVSQVHIHAPAEQVVETEGLVLLGGDVHCA